MPKDDGCLHRNRKKVNKWFSLYSITVTETIDLIKDIAYCYTVNHTNQDLTVLLWVFALFAFAYNIISIGIMT